MQLEDVTLETFEPYVGQAFDIHINEDEHLPLTLVEANPLGIPGQNRESFSLIFESPVTDKYAPQAIYTLHNETLGEIALFLVPLGAGEESFRYESVFT